MKTILALLLVVLSLASSSVEATKEKHNVGHRKCYTVNSKYCWEYKSCGAVRKRKRSQYPCKIRVCSKKCDLKCRQVMRKRAARGCKKSGKHVKCKYSWLSVPVKKCYRHCSKHCYRKPAVCHVIKVFKYPRLCAYKKRIYRKRYGHFNKPPPKVLKRKLVRTIRRKSHK